jgi:hypothetical protein
MPAPRVAAPDYKNDDSWQSFFISANKKIANWFDGFAHDIDVYLAGRQFNREKNPSKISLENRTSSVEGQEVTNDFGLSVLLRLPNLEEYWQLKFTSYDEIENKKNQDTPFLKRTPRKENYGASVGFFRKLGDVRLAFQPRIELQSPLKVSHLLSLKSATNLGAYSLAPTLELYATADKGTGVYWALDFGYKFNEKYSVTLVNNADYVSQVHTKNVTNGLILNEIWNDKISFNYGTFFFSFNQPRYHLEGYTIFTTLNYTVYRNILRYEITPHLDFTKLDGFRGRVGASLGIILDF